MSGTAKLSRRAQVVLIAVLASFVVIGASAVATLLFLRSSHNAPIPIGGPFAMTTADGAPITERSMQGRPFLVFFGFTNCPDICPTALAEVTSVFEKLGPNAKISALFVTVDPTRDTPDVLKSYLSSFDPRIKGVTGSPENLGAMMKAYRAFAQKVFNADGSDYTMDHTALIYVMDKNGQFATSLNLKVPPEEAAKVLAKYL